MGHRGFEPRSYGVRARCSAVILMTQSSPHRIRTCNSRLRIWRVALLHQRAIAGLSGYDPKSEVLETSMLSVCTTDLKNVNKKYRLPGQESGTSLQIFRSGWCYSSLRIPSVTGMICFADTGMTRQRSWQNQNRSSSFLNCLQTIAYIILPFSFS